MSFEQTLNDINIFCAHENSAIAEFAQRSISYAQALKQGEISTEEYHSLLGDIETLKSMCRTADEEYQVAKIFQAAMLITSLI